MKQMMFISPYLMEVTLKLPISTSCIKPTGIGLLKKTWLITLFTLAIAPQLCLNERLKPQRGLLELGLSLLTAFICELNKHCKPLSF